jgi:hypothetical protein
VFHLPPASADLLLTTQRGGLALEAVGGHQAQEPHVFTRLCVSRPELRSRWDTDAASLDLVVSIYGGGGVKGEGGLSAAFGGAAFFRDEETGVSFLGVWGARNASRFRSALRRRAALSIIRDAPPARLVWFGTKGSRTPEG